VPPVIDSAVSLIAAQLNQFLRRSLELSEDVVVVSNILEQDGTVAPNIDNKIVVFLTNIEKDTMPQAQPRAQAAGAGVGRTTVTTAPLYLNLYLMVAAYFNGSNYPEALKFISNTVHFFQSQPVLDHANTPDMDPRIDRLVLDIENLDIQQLSNLWGVLSGKYLPSVLYKVRMVAVDAGAVTAEPFTVVETRPLASAG
jgi:hypothetical protein